MYDFQRIVLTIALLAIGGTCLAQEENLPKIAKTIGNPADAAIGTRFNSEFSIQAGDADSKATLALTRALATSGNGHYRQLQIKVTAPFDKDKQDQIDVGTLSGLTAGTNASIESTWLRWPKFTTPDQLKYTQICEKYTKNLIPGYDWNLVGAFGGEDGAAIVCNGGTFTKANLAAAAKELKKKIDGCKEDCGPLTGRREPILAANADDIFKMVQADFQLVEDETITEISTFTVGLKVNQQKFNFVQPATPAMAESDTKQGWGVSVAYSRIAQGRLWSVGYAHEESYKATDKVQVCNPFENTTALICSNVSIGAPTKKSRELLFGEYRLIWNNKFGVSPRIEFDIEDSEWAIGVPVYLVANEEGQFTSGLKLGWDAENDFGVSIFIGKPFKFFD